MRSNAWPPPQRDERTVLERLAAIGSGVPGRDGSLIPKNPHTGHDLFACPCCCTEPAP